MSIESVLEGLHASRTDTDTRCIWFSWLDLLLDYGVLLNVILVVQWSERRGASAILKRSREASELGCIPSTGRSAVPANRFIVDLVAELDWWSYIQLCYWLGSPAVLMPWIRNLERSPLRYLINQLSDDAKACYNWCRFAPQLLGSFRVFSNKKPFRSLAPWRSLLSDVWWPLLGPLLPSGLPTPGFWRQGTGMISESPGVWLLWRRFEGPITRGCNWRKLDICWAASQCLCPQDCLRPHLPLAAIISCISHLLL